MKIKLFNNDVNCKSLSDFLGKNKMVRTKPEDFLEENKWLVFTQLTFSQKLRVQKDLGKATFINENDLTLDTFLPCPCELTTSGENVDKQLILKETNMLSSSKEVDNFIVNAIKSKNNEKRGDSLSPVVLWWGKSMKMLTSYLQDEMKNIWPNFNAEEYFNFDILDTDWIKSISTSVSGNGGNFHLNLIFKEIDESVGSIKLVENEEKITNYDKYITYGSIYKQNNDLKKSILKDYFTSIFNINDLFLISLNSDIDGIDYRDNYFDMIGLSDSVEVSVDANCNVEVNISGSDLMKLIKDDGSYFFNVSATNDVKYDLFGNINRKISGDVQDIDNVYYGQPFDRLRLPYGELNMFYSRNLDIATVILGTVSKLTNIQIAPNDVFEPWGNLRTRVTEFQMKK